MGKILNLEVNEIPPALISEYIRENPGSYLSKLDSSGYLKLLSTVSKDIAEDKLYPSQTWASFNTGTTYSEHKCYWYSDDINKDLLIWNRLAKKDISVGIVGSLHSSKLPDDLFQNRNYRYYIPDCFCLQEVTKPSRYKSFQRFNISLVSKSARVTNIRSLVSELMDSLAYLIFRPRTFGLSLYSLKAFIKILYFYIKCRNKEILRLCQFPLLGTICIDLLNKYRPEYSTLFTNHVAGNMHRYWYAHRPEDFQNTTKYPKRWVERNKDLVRFSIELLDDFLRYTINNHSCSNLTILITSSMGQSATKGFSERILSAYDAKITDMGTFIGKFQEYALRNGITNYEKIRPSSSSRNMAPQYGFKVSGNLNKKDSALLAGSFTSYVESIGLKSSYTCCDGSLVLTVDPYNDLSFQSKYSFKDACNYLANYGFSVVKIDDHHSGSHSPAGTLCILSTNKSDLEMFNQTLDSSGNLQNTNFVSVIEGSISSS